MTKNENWVEIIFSTLSFDYNSTIINTEFANIDLNEIDIYINDVLIKAEKNYNLYGVPIIYHFNKNSKYNVKVNIKKPLTTMNYLFVNCRDMKSISFWPGFDSSQVTSMEHMLHINIQSIDMK